MDIHQIIKYWVDTEEMLNTYKPSQLDNPRLSKATIDFLVNCGLPVSCAPGLSFGNCNEPTVPTPNQFFNIDLDELNDHDNNFERIYINSSVHQLTECIIRYREFYASLDPRFENNTFIRGKFSDEEFSNVYDDFKQIDDKSLLDNNCWKAELDYLLWERDNE